MEISPGGFPGLGFVSHDLCEQITARAALHCRFFVSESVFLTF